MRLNFVIAFLVLLLSSCGVPAPERLDFETDPRIFRGTYRAEVDLRVSSASIAYNAGGSMLAMANGDFFHAVQLWDIEKGTPIGAVGEGLPVSAVALSPNGDRVAAVIQNVNERPSVVRVWDTATGKAVFDLSSASSSCRKCSAGSIAFSPDGSFLAVAGGRDADREVALFNPATGERVAQLEGPSGSYGLLSFAPDGTKLAAIWGGVGYEEGVVSTTVWDMPSGKLVGTYRRGSATTNQYDAHMWHEGSPVVGMLRDGRLDLIALTSGDLVRSLPLPLAETGIDEVYASPDGQRLLGAYYDASRLDGQTRGAVIWNVETAEVAALEKASKEGTEWLGVFSPDGRLAATYADNTLTLRDADTLEIEKPLVNGAVVPLEVTAEATLVSQRSYRVEGMVRIGDDAPVPFSGEVDGAEEQVYQRLAPQMDCICPEPATLRATFSYRERRWNLRAYPGTVGSSGSWSADLAEASGKAVGALERALTLKKAR